MKYVSGTLYTLALIGFFATFALSLKPLADPKAKNLDLALETNRNIAARMEEERKAGRRPQWKKKERPPSQLAAPVLK